MPDQRFYDAIRKFNEMYALPAPVQPSPLGHERVRAFMDILSEEVAEGADLARKYEAFKAQAAPGASSLPRDAALDVLTEMSDWLGDLIVYCASEACRWGLPLDRILGIIMESNLSKLGADGRPIYDERGKVMKGPNYWRPEARIRELLDGAVAEERDAP